MIFSKEEIILAYTVEKCPKCEKLNRRDFCEGDVPEGWVNNDDDLDYILYSSSFSWLTEYGP